MNWIKRVLHISEKIKRVIKKRPSKEEIEKSDWTSCCKGPILKKDLEDNLWVCDSCGKHHRITCRQRFDIFFGKNNYEILKTPIPQDDPLDWEDSKKYVDRLKDARKKTNQDCAVMIASGQINGIKTIERDILYFTPSLDTHEPKKRFKVKKCIQKTSKKLSVANTVYKLSKLRYNLKISNIGSSNRTV